ncbi:phosphoglucomutase [Enterococcus sp. AZ194]|uniref:phospho-sugar mutase n=1 Tax=Enterococcus sp. AZ194 TaxID=2774629 RepID=UPI003F2472BA
MTWQKKYQEWSNYSGLDLDMKDQLTNLSDPVEREDRFYDYLAFGTGGMRGELGVGINRINSYTIRRVALGLATYVKEEQASKKGVVIAFDNRHGSQLFAEWTARVLASQGIQVYLSDQLRPTPELSFLVRSYKSFAGVMITASHNPKQYNGFKVYGADGGQITLETAERLMAILKKINNELTIDAAPLSTYVDQKLVSVFGEEVDERYLDELVRVIQSNEKVRQHGHQLSVVYTPLHGTGNVLIRKAFQRVGFTKLHVVEEQAVPDPDFSTVTSPNPEEQVAFDLALKEVETYPAQLILATDPDADRLGVVVIKEGAPIFLNGNQIGVLLLDYLIKAKQAKQEKLTNYFLAKTIVTSDLGAKIAESYGIQTRNTLTGFKFIGEQIQLSEERGDKKFLFGYEESYGYLVEPFVRDKDAVQAAVLLAETALDCLLSGSDLIERLDEIYTRFGYYEERLETQVFPGKEGISNMKQQLDSLRRMTFSKIGAFELAYREDYLTSERLVVGQRTERITLPSSNVLKYIFTDGSWVCLRPSGTEPKFKVYYSVNADTKERATCKLEQLQAAFHNLMNK